MAPASAAEFHFEASDGDFTYTYEKSGVTLAAATYYQSPITMAVVAGSMEVTASGYSGIYDKSAHGITVTAPSGAVVKYGTTIDEYNLDASPEYTNAGNYTVYYQVTKEKYTTVTGSATVIISQTAGSISFANDAVSLALSATAANNTYTQGVTKTGDGSVTYSISNNTCGASVDASTGKVTFTQAGSVTVTATVADSQNYTYATKTVSYTLTVKDTTDTNGGIPDNDDYGDGGNPF
jgi:hypothetical protein